MPKAEVLPHDGGTLYVKTPSRRVLWGPGFVSGTFYDGRTLLPGWPDLDPLLRHARLSVALEQRRFSTEARQDAAHDLHHLPRVWPVEDRARAEGGVFDVAGEAAGLRSDERLIERDDRVVIPARAWCLNQQKHGLAGPRRGRAIALVNLGTRNPGARFRWEEHGDASVLDGNGKASPGVTAERADSPAAGERIELVHRGRGGAVERP